MTAPLTSTRANCACMRRRIAAWPLVAGTPTVSRRAVTTLVISDDMAMSASSILISRSEEHTSELQSLMRISYAVFFLKEKKKIKNISTDHTQDITHYSTHNITHNNHELTVNSTM